MNIPIDKLSALLGAETVEDVKRRIGDLIVSRIEADMNDFTEYIFYPPDYQEFFDECFQEAQSKVRETIVQKMYNDMMKAYKSKGDD